MRLVYQTAYNVIIWLGPSNSDIDNLFDWMNELDKQVLTIPRPHTYNTWRHLWACFGRNFGEDFPPNDIVEALRRLLRREWFSRIWVLQEAALAKFAIINCGRKEVDSRTFVMMPSLLKVRCGEGVQARLDIMPGLLRAKSWWLGGTSQDLITLLKKFGRSKVSDDRDVIYALLGLSVDAYTSEILRPNYEIGLQEVVQNCVAYLLMRTKDLPGKSPVEGLPKWDIKEFLTALRDLPAYVFQWAMDHAQDGLLADLIVSQNEKQDFGRICQYMTLAGRHGPPITIAMKKENVVLLEMLLHIPDVDVYSKDSDGNTPLSIAERQSNTAVMEYISRLPDIDTISMDSNLLQATKRGNISRVESYLDCPRVDLSLVDENGDGPLNIAVRRGDSRIVDLLLMKSNSEHREFRGSDGLTPFESALHNGFPTIVKRLMIYHPLAVHEAVWANQPDLLCKILDVEPRLADGPAYENLTPLGTAADAGNTSIVALLLDKGAAIDLTGRDDRMATPLWLAASRGHLDTVRLLVEQGANLESMAWVWGARTSPLSAAASKGHGAVVRHLLKAGARPELAAGDMVHPALCNRPGNETVLWASGCAGHTATVT